jgi:hypothetical protein
MEAPLFGACNQQRVIQCARKFDSHKKILKRCIETTPVCIETTPVWFRGVRTPAGVSARRLSLGRCEQMSALLSKARVRLLRPLASDRPPFEEAVHRHDAAPRAVASRNEGRSRTVSDLALIGFRPPLGSVHQCGISPQRSGSSDASPVLWLRRMTSSSWLGAAFHRGG